MKEFDKKGNPSREPASEGMKGLSKFLPMTDSNYRRRLTEYEVQVQDLQAYVRSLETETGRLRKKLEDAPKEFMVLENKLREANRQLVQAFNQNEKLVNALYEAREQITSLKEEVDKLCAPPSTYGVYLSVNEDGTVNILSQGRKVKVNLHPSIKAEDIKPGQELILNEGLNVVETAGYEIQGEVVILKELLDDGARHRDPAGGRGPGRHHRGAAALGEAQDRRPPAHRRQERLPAREAARRARSRTSRWKRCPTSTTRTSAGSPARSRPSRTRSSCRTSTPTTTGSITSPRRRACCSTALRAAARP